MITKPDVNTSGKVFLIENNLRLKKMIFESGQKIFNNIFTF